MRKLFLIILGIVTLYSFVQAKIWTINPNGEYKYCSEIVSLVNDNDTVFIESASYENDVQVSWRKNNLFISGINGKPILIAGDKIANDYNNGKGIFVIQGNNTIVENIEFRNSKVPDYNGAGIRQEGSNLIVRNCVFNNNEMGILQGGTTSNCTIIIEYCEFKNNGNTSNPGYQHNIYINHIDTLIYRFNYTYDAIAEGHELKSRANNNFIYYNRISNLESVDSRNIDLPNGGTAVIVGNIIEQGQNSANSNIIGFGLEGLNNPAPHNLWICNNTIVNYKDKGNFFNISNIDTIFIKNNVCVGAKTGGFITGNYSVIDSGYNFVNDDINSAGFDNTEYLYRLNEKSPLINAGFNIDKIIKGHSLVPEYEMLDNLVYQKRYIDGNIDIGACEYKNNSSVREGNYDNLLLFPNPANDYLNICNLIKNEQAILIFNIFGECLLNIDSFENIFSNNRIMKRIDISSLSNGIYFVKAGNDIKMFVKE